ncbi:hypothetical protein [Pseudomonas chlororaphis]|uniref:DUF7693 domain-containing protein n=1 Tax=Pseudomonas chlororaphis TaxID=587753 RepID=A0A1Q8ESG2_9PSED|nr:hypothetical protein [Pseudomonas chlororaphis]OLF54732.1 hypothetical protein BTN82_12135 [Pseudomonas chlororaphis]
MPSTAALTAREVCQVLRDLALGTRTPGPSSHRVQRADHSDQVLFETDGWTLTLVNHGQTLSHCEACRAPDGRSETLDAWQRYGTDPVKLLSIWEHEQLQRLLRAL